METDPSDESKTSDPFETLFAQTGEKLKSSGKKKVVSILNGKVLRVYVVQVNVEFHLTTTGNQNAIVFLHCTALHCTVQILQ